MGKIKTSVLYILFLSLLIKFCFSITLTDKIIFTIYTIKLKSYKYYTNYQLLNFAFKYIDKNYKLTKKYPDYYFQFIDYFNKFNNFNYKKQKNIYFKAILGILNSIKDPYADIFEKNLIYQFTNKTYNIILNYKDNYIKIDYISKKSLAYNKFKKNDIILSIDKKKLKYLSDFNKYTINPGFHIFKIKRENKIIFIKIFQKIFKDKTIKFKITKDKNLYIKITNFKETTPYEFKNIIKNHQKYIKKIIIDLKDNKGGILYPVVKIASYFSNTKRLIFILKNKEKKQYYFTDPKLYFINKPVIILFNKNTASASEILINFLYYYNLASLKGNFTYGKKTTQTLIKVFYNYNIYLSNFKILNPEGKKLKNHSF